MKNIIIFTLVFVFLFSISPGQGYAACDPAVAKENGYACISNPITGIDNPNVLIGMVIKAVMGLVGSLALAMFIYGGLVWMTAAGNKEKVQKGKDVLVWAVAGLVVIFSAYAVVSFVLKNIAGTS